jgi:5,5'-dehydrodivanillate O-demethylase oxygenase subunit
MTLLSKEKNEVLAQTSAGTPMGELLRRYWHPVASLLELRERRVMPVRILGEDLVLFLTANKVPHLIARKCAHRGADLSYGWVDGEWIRCSYHGWAFDGTGRCRQMPFEEAVNNEPSILRGKAGLRAYAAAIRGGLVWAYLGPEPAPLVPAFEPFSWRHGFKEVIFSILPCNWFQCHENGMDPVHFEWLHTNWTALRNSPGESPAYAARHVDISFEEFEFGYICGRQVEDCQATDANAPMFRTSKTADGGVLCIWPNVLMTGPTIEWRVPVDDRTTMNVTWQYLVLPRDIPAPVQQDIPYWYAPITDGDRMISSHILNQDFTAWVGQGPVVDRSTEHLGSTDIGITRLRHRYLRETERVARGEDPPGLVRDPAANMEIQLPIRRKERYVDGLTREAFEQEIALQKRMGFAPGGYPSVLAGRPLHVRQAYDKILGMAG